MPSVWQAQCESDRNNIDSKTLRQTFHEEVSPDGAGHPTEIAAKEHGSGKTCGIATRKVPELSPCRKVVSSDTLSQWLRCLSNLFRQLTRIPLGALLVEPFRLSRQPLTGSPAISTSPPSMSKRAACSPSSASEVPW